MFSISPDSRFLVYSDTKAIYRVDVESGLSESIATMPPCEGGNSFAIWMAWGEDLGIVFSCGTGGRSGIYRLSPQGGTPEQLTFPTGDAMDRYHNLPVPLPGNRGLLFTRRAVTATDDRTVARHLDSGEERVVGPAGAFFSSGLLVYAQGESLFAEAFDPERFESLGERIPLGVAAIRTEGGRSRAFVANTHGTLLALTQGVLSSSQFMWFDRDGARRASLERFLVVHSTAAVVLLSPEVPWLRTRWICGNALRERGMGAWTPRVSPRSTTSVGRGCIG